MCAATGPATTWMGRRRSLRGGGNTRLTEGPQQEGNTELPTEESRPSTRGVGDQFAAMGALLARQIAAGEPSCTTRG
eukprot:5849999-Alexandrium_andersonii.AAC.1